VVVLLPDCSVRIPIRVPPTDPGDLAVEAVEINDADRC
jgi:hypothetical protein